MALHVAHLARRKVVKANDFIGPRNYQHLIGENPPPEMIEALRKGVHYVPKTRAPGFFKGKP
jgi:hypothetical protein